MQFLPLVELAPSQRECTLHEWAIASAGRAAVRDETYTCRLCGATWRRQIRHRRSGPAQAEEVAVPPWPTWEDIIAEP